MDCFLNSCQTSLQSSGQEDVGCQRGVVGPGPLLVRQPLQKEAVECLRLSDCYATARRLALLAAQKKSLARSERLQIEEFLGMAKKEDLGLVRFFFEACFPSPLSRKSCSPAVFLALENENWAGVELFLNWGVPASVSRKSRKHTVLLGEVIFDRCMEKLKQGHARSRGAVSCLRAWFQCASAQEKESLFSRNKTFETEGQRLFPEFWLMARDRPDILVLLLDSGLPLVPRKECGLLFSEEVLRFFKQESCVHEGLWSAIVSRCRNNLVGLFPMGVLDLSSKDLEEKIQEDWDELLADVRALRLQSSWATPVKGQGKRPRL